MCDGEVGEAEFESGGDVFFAVELFESIADMVDRGGWIGVGSDGDEVCGQVGEFGESLDEFGMGEWLVCGSSEPFAGDEFEFPVGWIGEWRDVLQVLFSAQGLWCFPAELLIEPECIEEFGGGGIGGQCGEPCSEAG